MITLDGLPLTDTDKWWLVLGTQLRMMPTRVSGGGEIPSRDGVLPSYGSPYSPGTGVLSFALKGSTRAEVEVNAEILFGILGQRRKLLSLKDMITGREAMIQVMDGTQPEASSPNLWRMTVPFQIPGGFWRDITSSDSALAITTSSTAVALADLGGSTGPINDALIRVQGGFSSVYVEDVVTGDRVTINAAVVATEYVVIDAAAWTARKVASDTWTGGTSIISAVASNRGSGPMVGFEPDFATGAGRIRARAVGTGITGSPKAVIRAKRSFL